MNTGNGHTSKNLMKYLTQILTPKIRRYRSANRRKFMETGAWVPLVTAPRPDAPVAKNAGYAPD